MVIILVNPTNKYIHTHVHTYKQMSPVTSRYWFGEYFLFLASGYAHKQSKRDDAERESESTIRCLVLFTVPKSGVVLRSFNCLQRGL